MNPIRKLFFSSEGAVGNAFVAATGDGEEEEGVERRRCARLRIFASRGRSEDDCFEQPLAYHSVSPQYNILRYIWMEHANYKQTLSV